MPDKWEQYAQPASGAADKPDKWEQYATSASETAPALDANPNREGVYRMSDASGKSLHVPYSAVRKAAQAGYTMSAEDRPRFVDDSAADPYLARDLFPDIPLREGVRIAGMNSAGQPIFAPDDDKPQGSATRRFLSSAASAIKQPFAGIYEGLTQGPQNADEAAMASDPFTGRGNMLFYRFTLEPQLAEARKAREANASGDVALTMGHSLAAAMPGVGPWAASVGERVGQQAGAGDIAGAAGTLAGNAAIYAAPEAAGKVARSELVSRTIPHGQITRLIRPMAADLKFGKDPAAAILSEGITGNTLEQVGDRVYERLHETGQSIDREAAKYSNRTVDLRTALKPLDDAMTAATKAGDKNLFAKLLDVKNELTQNWKPFRNARGEITLRATGPRNLRMTPSEALTFKRMVGDRIRWTQDPLSGEVNSALGSVYGEAKDAINAAVPKLRKLNEQYSNLVGAAKAIERRLPIEQRNAHWSLTDIVLGTHNLPLAAARHVARWPAVRTRAALALHNLPERVPAHPGLVAAPVTGAAVSSGQRLKQLREEAEQLRPAGAAY